MSVIYGGTYTNGVVLSIPSIQNPATVTATGYVGNGAGVGLLGEPGTQWIIDNYGTIVGANGSSRYAIELASGGSIDNAGSINGGHNYPTPAILIAGPGAITNSGTISGAVSIAGNGTVLNSGTFATSGIYLTDGGAVTNAVGGIISGHAVGHAVLRQTPGVVVSGGAGTIANLGTVAGGITLAGGSVVNGQSGASAALIGSAQIVRLPLTVGPGLYIAGTGTVTNFGTIGGLEGVQITGAATVANYGTILAPGAAMGNKTLAGPGNIGIDLEGGGTLTNTGSIGGYEGVLFGGTGYIGNTGAIITAAGSAATGVYLAAGGITILNSGTIAGDYGIGGGAADTTGDTVVNAGTIAGYGGTAIAFAGAGDLLVVEPGAAFVGDVVGRGSATMELAAGAGSLSGLGTSFTGFGAVRVDPGASWAISGGGSNVINDGTVIVDGALSFATVSHDAGQRGVIDLGNNGAAEFTAGVAKHEALVFTDDTGTALVDRPMRFKATISGFAAGDVIDLAGTQADTLTFANHQLVVSEAGRTVADLRFAGHYTASDFALSPDGNGGTDIMLTASTSASFWTMRV